MYMIATEEGGDARVNEKIAEFCGAVAPAAPTSSSSEPVVLTPIVTSNSATQSPTGVPAANVVLNKRGRPKKNRFVYTLYHS
jgi:hypothetical protein